MPIITVPRKKLNSSGCPSNREGCGVMYNLLGLFWGGRQADLNSVNTHKTRLAIENSSVFTRKDKVPFSLFMALLAFCFRASVCFAGTTVANC